MEEEPNRSLEYTPTWVVAVVCSVIVLISLCVERSLHRLGKYLKHKQQDALFQALQKLKEELMLLGFISLLLTVFQRAIGEICIPSHLANYMLPCKRPSSFTNGTKSNHYDQNYRQVIINRRRLLSEESFSDNCIKKGKVPLLSLEAIHHLHIFIFVLAVVHTIFCVTTMVLGNMRTRQWKTWEDVIRKDPNKAVIEAMHHYEFFEEHGGRHWRRAAVVSWLISFCKQFYGSVTQSDYTVLRQGFIKKHYPNKSDFDFHKHMMETLEVDFKKVVGIRWYLWLFVVLFLLLNLEGWHTYFWLAFLPLMLLVLVGAKLEHIITRLAQESTEKVTENQQGIHYRSGHKANEAHQVKPSDDYFWFSRPSLVLDLIHFILFQNSFEIAFFFWILCTYGFDSCIMEKVAFIIPRLIIGVIVQVLCSYSTLPLYTIVTQMGDKVKLGNIDEKGESSPLHPAEGTRRGNSGDRSKTMTNLAYKMAKEPYHHQGHEMAGQAIIAMEGTATSVIELSGLSHSPLSLSS